MASYFGAYLYLRATHVIRHFGNYPSNSTYPARELPAGRSISASSSMSRRHSVPLDNFFWPLRTLELMYHAIVK